MSDIVKELCDKYGLVRDRDIWPVPGGRSWAIKHSVLERIAAEKGITFGPPTVIEADTQNKVATILVTASLDKQSVWSFGEASAANCKNAYIWAMAEKRAKDRCILKLLAVHGEVYSEDEADDFRQKSSPVPVTSGPKKSSHAIKRDTPEAWPNIVNSFRNARSYAELRDIAASEYVQEMTKDWPVSWTDQLREEYQSLADTLRDGVAA